MTDRGSPLDYVEAIERHLARHRGREHVLSPRDFAIARGWHQAGVPLATVLSGLDRAFAREPGASSLAFCRATVEDLFAGGRTPSSGRGPGSPID